MKYYLIYFSILFLQKCNSQVPNNSCEIESVYYQSGYVADLGMIAYEDDVFQSKKPRNSWTYEFTDGLITGIKFDPTNEKRKSAKLIYNDKKLTAVVFDGGPTSKKEFIYNGSGQIIKFIEYSAQGNLEKTYEVKDDILVESKLNEETNSNDIQEIIFDESYQNLTFPFGNENYFDELFSIQKYSRESGYVYERTLDDCGNTIRIIKRFKTFGGEAGTIQEIKTYEIKYK